MDSPITNAQQMFYKKLKMDSISMSQTIVFTRHGKCIKVCTNPFQHVLQTKVGKVLQINWVHRFSRAVNGTHKKSDTDILNIFLSWINEIALFIPIPNPWPWAAQCQW